MMMAMTRVNYSSGMVCRWIRRVVMPTYPVLIWVISRIMITCVMTMSRIVMMIAMITITTMRSIMV